VEIKVRSMLDTKRIVKNKESKRRTFLEFTLMSSS
jgi:hypothetical protein